MDIPTVSQKNIRKTPVGRSDGIPVTFPPPWLSAGSDADLTPWRPTQDDPSDAAKAAHLLRRVGFGLSSSAIDQALASDPTTVVITMLLLIHPLREIGQVSNLFQL